MLKLPNPAIADFRIVGSMAQSSWSISAVTVVVWRHFSVWVKHITAIAVILGFYFLVVTCRIVLPVPVANSLRASVHLELSIRRLDRNIV